MKQRRTLAAKRNRPTDHSHSRDGDTASDPPRASADGDTRSRDQLIAVEAYLLAERRGFAPGFELDDWLAAQALVEARAQGAHAGRMQAPVVSAASG